MNWIKAPMGWWLIGAYRAKLAHLWTGADGRAWAVIFRKVGENLSRGPYPTEDVGMKALVEELTPKPKTA